MGLGKSYYILAGPLQQKNKTSKQEKKKPSNDLTATLTCLAVLKHLLQHEARNAILWFLHIYK